MPDNNNNDNGNNNNGNNNNNGVHTPRELGSLVVRYRTVLGELKTVEQEFDKLPDTGSVDYGTTWGKWGPHVSTLARSCGTAVSVGRSLFPALPFGGQDLYDQDATVHELGDLLAMVEEMYTGLQKVYNKQRVKLMDMTFMVVDQVTALDQMPSLPAEQRTLLSQIYPPIERVLAERKEKVQASRRSGKKLKQKGQADAASAQAKTQLAEAETKVLRGGKLSLPPAAAPVRKTKRR